MDPYEKERQEHHTFRLYEKWLRLQLIAAEKLPLPKQRESQELSAQNMTKSSRIAEFVRGRPALPKPAKVGIGLVALVATLVGGLLWRRRRK